MSQTQNFLALIAALWQLTLLQLRGEYWIQLRSTELWGKGIAPRQLKRCRHYFRGALFLGAVFAAQRGQALRSREMRQFARLAALAALFDDKAETLNYLTTHNVKTAAKVHETLSPSISTITLPASLFAFARQTDPDGTLLFLWKNISPPAETAALFKEKLLKVFDLETQAMLLDQRLISVEALIALANEKGGNSALLFRLLMQPPPSPGESHTALALGALVQSSDDLFDLWHDAQKQIITPARYWAEANRLDLAERHFKERWKHLAQAINAAPAASARARRTALILVGLLTMLTRFCLHHYGRLAQKHGTLPWHDRRTMVLDMARWSTRLRAVMFACKNRFFLE
ncbi:MAG: hypothetical protein RMJ33_04045 [Saprospiraceae bacterium]|nr:hypothetical protein [Saprospiraceae bacterium]MDW8228988.1 hypothetical protein [Saprospiraceae bacterium]